MLTALPREDWAALRPAVPEDYLRSMDEALFVVSLERGLGGRDLAATAKDMLVGSRGNRWFDKWQVAVDLVDGTAGMNLEHSPYDGHAFVSLINNMWQRLSMDLEVPNGTALAAQDDVRWLNPGNDAVLRKGVDRGRALLDQSDRSLSLALLHLAPFGTDAVKRSLRCSPDAFMQLAFQIAWNQHAGHIGSTYESGQVKRFLAGRTETIRPVTRESAALVSQWATLAAASDQRARLRQLYDAAALKHVERVQVAKTGAGWDRHLFALKQLARHKQQRLPEHVFSMPALFTDPSFAHYFTIEVSTSNSGAEPFRVFSFGPVTPSGVGLGYQTFPDRIDVCATMHNQPASLFVKRLEDTMTQMRAVLN